MLVRGRLLPSEWSNLLCHHVCRLPTYAGNVLLESGRMTGELVVMMGEAEKAALMSHGRDSGSDESEFVLTGDLLAPGQMSKPLKLMI